MRLDEWVNSVLVHTRTESVDCRCEHCGISCGTRHVHVLWHNLCVYEQVASPQWRRWSTRTIETFATVSTPWKHSSSFRTSHVMQSLHNCNTTRSSLHGITSDVVSCFMETHKVRRISSQWFFISSSATPSPTIRPSVYISIVHHDKFGEPTRRVLYSTYFIKSSYPDVDKTRADQWIVMYSVIVRSVRDIRNRVVLRVFFYFPFSPLYTRGSWDVGLRREQPPVSTKHHPGNYFYHQSLYWPVTEMTQSRRSYLVNHNPGRKHQTRPHVVM